MPSVRVKIKKGGSTTNASVNVSSKTPTESEVMAAPQKKYKRDGIVILKIG